MRSAGVVVGRVGNISFDTKGYQAQVELKLNKDVVFPKDTSAKILTSGLLGEQYIGLEPGFGETNLAQGDTIKSTQSAIVRIRSLASRRPDLVVDDDGGCRAGDS